MPFAAMDSHTLSIAEGSGCPPPPDLRVGVVVAVMQVGHVRVDVHRSLETMHVLMTSGHLAWMGVIMVAVVVDPCYQSSPLARRPERGVNRRARHGMRTPH